MYTALRIDNSFHIAINGHGRMKSHTKFGIIRLIMTNLLAWRDIASKGFVTVTTDLTGFYTEMKLTWQDGKIVIVSTFRATED